MTLLDEDALDNPLQSQPIQTPVLTSEQLALAILNSLTANIAVLDHHGTIIMVNEAWTRFARENSPNPSHLERTGIGANYLEVCRTSQGAFGEEAQEAAA